MPVRWLQPLGFYQAFVWWQPKRIYDGAFIAARLQYAVGTKIALY